MISGLSTLLGTGAGMALTGGSPIGAMIGGQMGGQLGGFVGGGAPPDLSSALAMMAMRRQGGRGGMRPAVQPQTGRTQYVPGRGTVQQRFSSGE